MALDKIGLRMLAPRIKGASVLCLGYPDITAPHDQVLKLLGVEPRKFTDYGRDHKISWRLPETVDTLMLAGAKLVHCVDSMPSRGCERLVDLNVRQEWPQLYDVVINPGTLEHCFDIATATFNAWRALAVGGVLVYVAPMTMMNHGFYNICPTLVEDFAKANGGAVVEWVARDREWAEVPISKKERFRAPAEVVLYARVVKEKQVPETIPVQGRYG